MYAFNGWREDDYHQMIISAMQADDKTGYVMADGEGRAGKDGRTEAQEILRHGSPDISNHLFVPLDGCLGRWSPGGEVPAA